MRSIKKIKVVILLLCTCSLFYTGCKKLDISHEPNENASKQTQSFFRVPPNTEPIVLKIIDEIKKRNNKKEFVSDFAVNNGYPIWDKAILGNKRNKGNSSSFSGGNASDTLVFIPFVIANQSLVNGYILATITDSIGLSYSLAKDYKAYPFNPDSTQLSASNFAMRIMIMENQVFGYTKFNITDERLFHEHSTDYNDTSLYNLQITLTEPAQSTSLLASFCYTSCAVHVCSVCSGNDPDCPQGGTWTNCSTNCIWYDDGNSGNPPPPGGGGGGGGEIPPAFPCTPVLNPSVTSNQNTGSSSVLPGGPLPPCPGPGTGWVPTLPYVCNRPLTQNEQDIFNQLDAEDAADNLLSPLDCKGTKARGNINFTGVKEHWLLQLDFVSKNPTYGEIEYQIPFASSNNPLYRGRADMVNMLSGYMFEIKPKNFAGLAAGIAEVATYVTKANTYCTSSLPFGTAWHAGSTFTPVTLPTGVPNRFLTASMESPGVITYQYIITTNPPIPVPIIVPFTVLDKFKTLVDRLKDNLADADRIMAEFLAQNPTLTTYIKTAAITAGVAIIVATLLDDMTLVGILDDAAGFMAAYRIVRFALLLP